MHWLNFLHFLCVFCNNNVSFYVIMTVKHGLSIYLQSALEEVETLNLCLELCKMLMHGKPCLMPILKSKEKKKKKETEKQNYIYFSMQNA